jgi:hypothetical protein
MSDRLIINVFNIDPALAVGRAKGLFAANGLDLEVIITPNSTDQMRGLGKNSWQIVSTAFDNVLGWSGREGVQIVAIAQVSQGVTLPVYVRPEIKTWDDLRGKAWRWTPWIPLSLWYCGAFCWLTGWRWTVATTLWWRKAPPVIA